MKIIKISATAVATTVALLKGGGVVICPTDTVYGFLADALNKKAVEKIYKIKKRSKSKSLPVFVKDLKMAKEVAFIDKKQAKICAKFWPGKYTFILNRKPGKKLFGVNKNTIALRIPKHAFLNNVLKKINRPLVQTSVNVSDETLLKRIGDIIKQFGKSDILIIDAGNIKSIKSSRILNLINNKIVRK